MPSSLGMVLLFLHFILYRGIIRLIGYTSFFFEKKQKDLSTTPTPPSCVPAVASDMVESRNEGSQPLPQTPFPLQGRDLIDSDGDPLRQVFGMVLASRW